MDVVRKLISCGRTLRHPTNPSRSFLADLQQNIRDLFTAIDTARGNEGSARADEFAWLDDIETRGMEIADSLQMYMYQLRKSGPVGRPVPGPSEDARTVNASADDEYQSTLISAKAGLRLRLLQLGDIRR